MFGYSLLWKTHWQYIEFLLAERRAHHLDVGCDWEEASPAALLHWPDPIPAKTATASAARTLRPLTDTGAGTETGITRTDAALSSTPAAIERNCKLVLHVSSDQKISGVC